MNRKKTINCLILGGIFLLMLALNILTPMYLDDYAYCYSWADGERIRSFAQLFPSMRAHASIMNGRLVCHFLVQLSLYLPHLLFKFLNAGMFVILLLLLERCCLAARQPLPLFTLLLFAVVWYFVPAFGQVMLWQDGSVNYLWGAVFSLLFLLPYVSAYYLRHNLWEKPVHWRILFVLYGFPVGAYSEVSAFSVIGGAILFLSVTWLLRKEKPTCWQILPVLSAFAGFLAMLSMPAERMNKTDSYRLVDYINHFMNETEMYYTRLFPLLAVWLALFLLSIHEKIERKNQIASICFLLISLASNYVLIIASFYPDRVMLMCTLYLIAACGTLLPPLLQTYHRVLMQSGFAIFGLVSAYSLLWGCYDVYRSHNIVSDREAYIAQQKALGESNIVTPYVDAWTKYSVTYGTEDLDPTSRTDWPNEYAARYYGLESIMGCEPESE